MRQLDDLAVSVSKEIVEMEKNLKEHPEILKRYYASFSQIDQADKAGLIQKFLAKIDDVKARLATQKETLLQEQKQAESKEQLVDSSLQQRLAVIENQKQALESASAIIRKNQEAFKTGAAPFTQESV